MRYALMAMSILLGSATPAVGQVSIGISVPGVSIGINQPVYPELILVPGYPVYYAPRLHANYFFYDGSYWVYHGDHWYMSFWYNGPWELVDPYHVPLFVLRVPVRYYRAPPVYFRGWYVDAPPRWGHHWGPQWEQRRRNWDRWDRRAAPPVAPPPVYQRQYAGDRYPRAEQQHELRNRHYRYQPREEVVRQRYQEQAAAPSRAGPQGDPPGARARMRRDRRQPRPRPNSEARKFRRRGNSRDRRRSGGHRHPANAKTFKDRRHPQQYPSNAARHSRSSGSRHARRRSKSGVRTSSVSHRAGARRLSPMPTRSGARDRARSGGRKKTRGRDASSRSVRAGHSRRAAGCGAGMRRK